MAAAETRSTSAAVTTPPKNSRARTGEGEGHGLDHFSTLSDDLVVHILAFLPLRKAISASILSRRWRYLWTHTPNLDFLRRISERFVDRFLIFHKATKIRAFEIDDPLYTDGSGSDDDRAKYSGQRYDSWLHFAVSRNVEHLSFEVYNRFLFWSKSLTKLEVGCHIFVLPKFICMPALKCLILSQFSNLRGDDIRYLTSRCPILDSLSLLHCGYNRKLSVVVTNPSVKRLKVENSSFVGETEIHAPSILCLEFSGTLCKKITVENLVSLVELKIDLYHILEDRFMSDLSHLLHSVHQPKLHLGLNCVEALHGSRIEHLPTPSVQTTCLHLCTSLDKSNREGIAYLLNSFPNLEFLKLEVYGYPEEFHCEEPSHHLEEAFSSGLKSVKRVEVDGILSSVADDPDQVEEYMKQYKHELELIGIFIRNAVALEKMSIRTQMKIL